MQLTPSEPLFQFRRLNALIVKEILQISRDISSVLISVVLPVLLLFIYGYGISLNLKHLKIGLVIEDTSPDARSFAQSLSRSPYFDLKIVMDRRLLYGDMEKSIIRGMVIIPASFSKNLYSKQAPASIQVISDGSEPNTSTFVTNYMNGALQNWMAQKQIISGSLMQSSIVSVEPRYWYNEGLESRFFLLPGALAVVMTLVGSLLTALVIAREWERGTMESVISTPVTVLELILGKMIPYFILGIISFSICFFLSVFLFELPFRGSYWLLMLTTSVFLFCALSFGLMVSTIAKNQIIAYQVALITAFLPAYMLSDFIFEISSMPNWIQVLTNFLYPRYYVQSLLTIFLAGNVWKLLFFNMLPTLAFGVLFFSITLFKTVKRLD
jgi:ABC-2 type transport system permease protein